MLAVMARIHMWTTPGSNSERRGRKNSDRQAEGESNAAGQHPCDACKLPCCGEPRSYCGFTFCPWCDSGRRAMLTTVYPSGTEERNQLDHERDNQKDLWLLRVK